MKKLIKRFQADTLRQHLRNFPVVAVIGARQTGKTTLVRDLLPGNPATAGKRKFISFDEPVNMMLAEQDAASFLKQADRITIDEVQKAPALFTAIKQIVDRKRTNGQFLITGSANITMLPQISESLAGRVAFVEMSPFSALELSGSDSAKPKLMNILTARTGKQCWRILSDIKPRPIPLEKYIWRGGLPPAFLLGNDHARQEWFKGYVRTYLERDVRDLSRIQRLYEYQKFLTLLAFRSAQIFNKSEVARDCGLPNTTAGHFLDLLLATFQVWLLPPYFRNIGKRLIKAPKLMWNDTGLAMHLQGLHTWEDACRMGRDSFMAENKIAIELKTILSAYEPSAKLFYWRTSGGAEIDFIIESRGRLIPIEVKWKMALKPRDMASMDIFCKDFKDNSPWGIILYKGKDLIKVKENIFLVPFEYFLQ
jgi:predicted AAA+ superfamily ATPase